MNDPTATPGRTVVIVRDALDEHLLDALDALARARDIDLLDGLPLPRELPPVVVHPDPPRQPRRPAGASVLFAMAAALGAGLGLVMPSLGRRDRADGRPPYRLCPKTGDRETARRRKQAERRAAKGAP